MVEADLQSIGLTSPNFNPDTYIPDIATIRQLIGNVHD
jgi:hypothetical protein